MLSCVVPPAAALAMDWGLPLGSARYAARAKNEPSALSAILGATLTAKLLLAFSCCLLSPLVQPFLPRAEEWIGGYYAGVLLGVIRGFNPFWFFQGSRENVSRLALWETGSTITALALIFIFIRSPNDWALYLYFLCACKGIAYFRLNIGLWRLYKPAFKIKRAFKILAKTRILFACSLASLVCNNGSQLIMAYFLSSAQIGVIVAANKMARAMAAFCEPVTQTIFPEICEINNLRAGQTRRILFLSIGGTFSLAVLGACCAAVFAPFIVRLALGGEYEFGVYAARAIFAATPFLVLERCLTGQILTPFDREKLILAVWTLAALFAPALAALLAARGGLNAAAWTNFCVESFLCAGFILLIVKYPLNAMRRGKDEI